MGVSQPNRVLGWVGPRRGTSGHAERLDESTVLPGGAGPGSCVREDGRFLGAYHTNWEARSCRVLVRSISPVIGVFDGDDGSVAWSDDGFGNDGA